MDKVFVYHAHASASAERNIKQKLHRIICYIIKEINYQVENQATNDSLMDWDIIITKMPNK